MSHIISMLKADGYLKCALTVVLSGVANMVYEYALRTDALAVSPPLNMLLQANGIRGRVDV